MSAPANHAAPATPQPAAVSPLVAVLLALSVAVAIYGGLTLSRIDAARTEVLTEVRALRADVQGMSDRVARIEEALTAAGYRLPEPSTEAAPATSAPGDP